MTDLQVEDLYEIQGIQIYRGHMYMYRAHFSALRVVNSWNKLPSDIVAANSVEGFKINLDRVWPHIFPGIK